MSSIETFNSLFKTSNSCDYRDIGGNALSIEYEKINDNIPHRFNTRVGGARFECCYYEQSTNWFFIFLPGARGNDPRNLPRFSRWSRSSLIDGITLCVEDPMYYTYPKLKYGWFVGTENENYLEYLARLIEKIATIKGIPNNHIVLFGSSAGGSVAINCSRYLPDAMAVAINPQYLPSAPPSYNENFYKETGHHIQDYSDRISIIDSINTNKNKILLAFNTASNEDYQGYLNFCKKNNIRNSKSNVEIHNNVIIWKFNAPGLPNPHMSYENQVNFPIILFIISAMHESEKLIEMYSYEKILKVFSDIWGEKYQILQERRIKEIMQTLLSNPMDDRDDMLKELRSYIHYGQKKIVDNYYELYIRGCITIDELIKVHEDNNIVNERYIKTIIDLDSLVGAQILTRIRACGALSGECENLVNKYLSSREKKILVPSDIYARISNELGNNDATTLLLHIRGQRYAR